MKMQYLRFSTFLSVAVWVVMALTGCEDDGNPLNTGTINISLNEGTIEEHVGMVAITFSSDRAFATNLEIAYELSGTATPGNDYEILSGTVTLLSGETNVVQQVTILDDTEIESQEELTIRISSINGGQTLIGVDREITLIIVDDDSFAYENGILVLHEGNFGGGNASVSFVPEDLGEVQNGIFKSANMVDNWGDTAQSITFFGDLAYIVVNNSQKIEVVNRYTFVSVTTIGGGSSNDFLNPRYMAIANGKGYVTNWGDGTDANDDFVAVVNLETNRVETKIPVEEGPEAVIANETTVYVAHQGGFNQNNIVTVINATTNQVATTVTVADRPNSLQFDANGDIWVLSGGNPSWTGNETAGQLDKISTSDNSVVQVYGFETSEHPSSLVRENSTLYYLLSGSVFEMDVLATALPESAALNGLNWGDMSVRDGKIYGVNAKDFVNNGSLEVYDLDDHSLVTSKEVALIPTGVYFNGTADR